MRKIGKQMAGILLTLTMVLAAIPADMVSAHFYEEAPTKMVATLYSPKDIAAAHGKLKNRHSIGGYSKKVKKLKSSNKSVAELSKETFPYGRTYTALYVNVKKPGIATLSYKVGSKTHKIKVTVRKYENPVHSIKVGKKVISGKKFNKRSACVLKYKDFANKKTKINIKLAENWTFEKKRNLNNYVDTEQLCG